MQVPKILFTMMLACLVCANCLAQDETKTSNPKATKAKAKAVKTLTTQLMKAFSAANLTDEQKTKAAALIEKHIGGVMEARKAEASLLTDEQKKARTAAMAKAKEDGLKGAEMNKAVTAALGLSEEKLKELSAAKKKITAAQNKIKNAITGLLTDEQKAAMPKKGKGGKKKKADGEKKKADGEKKNKDS